VNVQEYEEWAKTVTVRTLDSGYFRIDSREIRPFGWCQVPHWPATEEEIERGTFKPETHQHFSALVAVFADEYAPAEPAAPEHETESDDGGNG
jgi:hypothetical protein